MKMIIEIDDDTYNSLDLYVRNDSKGKGVIHNCLHAIKNGIPVNENDLGVDCISRTSALDSINWAYNLSDAYQKINDLPSVTTQEPKTGHWTEEFNDLEGEVRFTCSSCGKYQLFGTDFCYHCGSDNREVVEE